MSIFYVLPNKDYYAADDECQELDQCELDGVIPALTDILAITAFQVGIMTMGMEVFDFKADKKNLATIKSLYFKSY